MPHVQRATLSIPAMRGEWAVFKALRDVEGVRSIAINDAAKQVEVEYDEAVIPIERVEAILGAADQPVAGITLHRQRRGQPGNGENDRGMESAAMATDPVCGMRVDPTTARRTSEYAGRTYFFCSPGCKRAFEANPQQYIGMRTVTDDVGPGCACCSA